MSESSPAENPKEVSSPDPPELPSTPAAAAGDTGPDAAVSVSVATPVVPEGWLLLMKFVEMLSKLPAFMECACAEMVEIR